MPEITQVAIIREYEFMVYFLDTDDNQIDRDSVVIEVEQTDDPEQDRDTAHAKATDWAELNFDLYGVENAEITLVDAH